MNDAKNHHHIDYYYVLLLIIHVIASNKATSDAEELQSIWVCTFWD